MLNNNNHSFQSQCFCSCSIFHIKQTSYLLYFKKNVILFSTAFYIDQPISSSQHPRPLSKKMPLKLIRGITILARKEFVLFIELFCSFNKSIKKRRNRDRTRLVLWVELSSNKVWVIFNLNDFNQFIIRRNT